MASLKNLHLIALTDPGENLREAVQQMVKQYAENWWHQMPDIWIVEGGTAVMWRDRLIPLKTAAGSSAISLVIRLPDSGSERWWAGSGQTALKEFQWFFDNYTQSDD